MIECYFENHDKVNLRHVTTGVIVVKDGKILLEKRGTYKGKPIPESGKWALIGGYLDRDENLIAGAKRETLEETGWQLDNLKLLRVNDTTTGVMGDRQNIVFVFIAEAISQTLVNSEEAPEVKWFDLENLPSKEEMAFDHFKDLELYKKHIKENFAIPVLG